MKKIYLSLGIFIILSVLFFPKHYYPNDESTTDCKTLLTLQECLGKSLSTPTTHPCDTSAVCYGLLIKAN